MEQNLHLSLYSKLKTYKKGEKMQLNYYSTTKKVTEISGLSGIYTTTGSALNYYAVTSSALFYGC